MTAFANKYEYRKKCSRKNAEFINKILKKSNCEECTKAKECDIELKVS